MKLYGYGTPNVLKINIMLEEVEARYDLHKLDIWKGEQFADSFVALNLNSKIPVFVDEDGMGGSRSVITESGAILFYLAEKSGKLFSDEPSARVKILEWLMFQTTSIGPMCGQFNHFKSFAPAGNDYALSRYTTEMKRLYGVVESRLAQARYMAGDDYSIADIALFPWIRNQAKRYGELGWTRVSPIDYPAIARWFDEIDTRPAVRRATRIFDGIGSTFAMATADDLDRVFGRGVYASA